MHPVAQARGLIGRGHAVTLVASPGSPMARAARDAGVDVRTFAMPWYADPVSLLRLRRAIASARARIVHVHDPRDLWRALLARPRGVAVVAHRHSAGAGAPRRDPLHRRATSQIDRTIAITEYVARRTRALYDVAPDRVTTIPYGIEPVPVDPEARAVVRMALRDRAPEVTRWIVVVAQLSRGKRQDVAVRALASLPEDVGLALVGGEASRGYGDVVAALARDLGVARRVWIVGHRRKPGAWMAEADALVLPTDAESFGRVLVEAMTVGTPCVAAAGGGVPEVVRDEETGLLFEPGDADACAAAVRRVLDDPALARRLTEAARKDARERFAPEVELAAIERVYDEVAA